METIRLTKRFTFEMGHALFNYDGKCKHLHGHSYKLFVTIKGRINQEPSAPNDGMVCDFTVLKEIVKTHIIEKYDHALVLNSNDTEKAQLANFDQRIILFPFQPTCENLLLTFKNEIVSRLPLNLQLANIKLYETETAYAEWDILDQI